MSGGIITTYHQNNSIKALVFDFDGLILDTELPEFLSWQRVYQSHGAQLELDEWLKCVGTSPEVFNPIEILQTRVNVPLEFDQIIYERKKIFNQLINPITPLPGVLDYLNEAKHMGLSLAIASSSPSHWVNNFLRSLNLYSIFDAICVAEDVMNVKPDPSLYLCATQRLGVKPNQTIAFEDSYNGLLAAKNAGLYCVAVPNQITHSMNFNLADKILNSLAEVPLPDLLESFNVFHID